MADFVSESTSLYLQITVSIVGDKIFKCASVRVHQEIMQIWLICIFNMAAKMAIIFFWTLYRP